MPQGGRTTERAVRSIALWMILSVYPWSGDLGLERRVPVVLIYDVAAVVCGVGLFFLRGWAWWGAVRLFWVYEAIVLYVVMGLIGPSFSQIVNTLSGMLYVPASFCRSAVVSLLVVYLVWPVVVILFLTSPRVKEVFDYGGFVAEDEDAPAVG